jgi:polysaccharide pyruvyl transferase WcaK-like protein
MEDPSAVIEAHQKRVEELNGERFELEDGATSLTLLQAIYRSSAVALSTRMRAAIAAIQFEHPKLAVTATVEAGDFAFQLDQAVERSRKVSPMIEANVSSDTANVPSETKRPSNGVKPMIPDRRFRR